MRWFTFLIAAAVIIGGIYRFWEMNRFTTVRIAHGEQVTHRLPDGSQAFIKGESSIRYRHGSWVALLEIYVAGEVRLEMREGPPVRARLATVIVTADAAAFNIRAHDGRIDIDCTAGEIGVLPTGEPQNTVRLSAGHGVTVGPDGAINHPFPIP